MARRDSHRRNVDGVLLLDKPQELTSNKALQIVKRLFKARKAGHTGSLDPLATGLLPICFGEATKMSGFLLDADKSYWVRVKLGESTDTGDADGTVVDRQPVPELTPDDIERALEPFRGEITQIPPMYSALRHQGKRLYELARKGEEVERKPRRVTLYELALHSVDLPEIELRLRCSKGTYVRTLVEDLGKALGCGAHVTALRRIQVGPFGEDADLVSLESLRERLGEGVEALDAFLLPIESTLSHWPAVHLSPDADYYLQKGQPVIVPRAPTTGWVRLYGAEGRFLGAGEVLDDGRIAPRRLLRRE
ncbi:MAG: tRNA pseudouridine(55) synthase TruB [Gammaproteobacteria bacterium]